jgi:DNA-binding response OmpR family regulator
MTSADDWESRWGLIGGPAFPAESQILLVATPREWFKSALEAVLQPEGFTVLWAHDSTEVLDFVQLGSPDLVIVDESIGPVEAPELCRALQSGPLSPAVPLVLYASDMTTEKLQSRVLQAGAWEVIREPIRAEYLLAALRRLLHIGRQVAGAGEWGERDGGEPDADFLTLTDLTRLLPRMEAMAERSETFLSCAVVGLTSPPSGEEVRREWSDIPARLCASHVRRADLCGRLGKGDVAIVAFGTDRRGAESLVRRLESVSPELMGTDEVETTTPVLSAGIVELPPSVASNGEAGPRPAKQKESVSEASLMAARRALEEVRDEGGGIKVAEPDPA